MNKRNWMIGMLTTGMLASGVMAQTLPPAPGGDRGGPPPREGDRGPGGPGGPGGGPRDGDRGPGGPRDGERGPGGPRDGERGPGGREGGPRGEGERGGPGGPRDGERGPGGPRGDGDRGPGGPGERGPGGPGGMGGPGGRRDPIGALSDYLQLVDRYTTLASNPSASGVSAVVSLSELMKSKGPQATIDKLNEVMGQAKDPAVQRAIRLQLIDLYKASKQEDKAIEQAVILIQNATPAATQAGH